MLKTTSPDNKESLSPSGSSTQEKRGRPPKTKILSEESVRCSATNCSLCINGPPSYFQESVPTWADILQVVLYTLAQNSPEKAFFSLSSDIYPFVSSHLRSLGCEKYIGSSWKQTVKMTLSHARYSHLFENGYETYYKTGLWRVKQDIKPYKKNGSGSNRTAKSDNGQNKRRRNSISPTDAPPKKKMKLENSPPKAPNDSPNNKLSPKKNNINDLLHNDNSNSNKITKASLNDLFFLSHSKVNMEILKKDQTSLCSKVKCSECVNCQKYRIQFDSLNQIISEKEKVIEYINNENTKLKKLLQKFHM